MIPTWLMGVGGVGVALGILISFANKDGVAAGLVQFGFSWLQAYMFFLSLCLGGLGMVILHHLFDASWSVPTRRICEQLACLLFPAMFVLFLPIAALAPWLYGWVARVGSHPAVPSITAKYPLFTLPGFYLVVVLCFVVWWMLASNLRYWSLKQDESGAARCTVMMRRYSAAGVFLYAITLTLAAIMWMKSLYYEWFSTMYGVQYFAASMWVTLFTLYTITVILKRQGPLREVATDKTFYYIGSLMFAFTVFYGYVTFFQYFIIWNANIPEETFWYVLREKGTWWDIGLVIIFGHFFVPFLSLLRIDVKVSKLWVMIPLGLWAWLMHYAEIAFQVTPVQRPNGFTLNWLDIACWMFICGVLVKIFLKMLYSHPIVPQKDPRIAEAMDIYVEPISSAGIAPKTGGGH